MFPDVYDVQQAMRRLRGGENIKWLTEENVWPNAALVRAFLHNASRWTWNTGRHRFVPATELKRLAEAFIDKPISDYEFCVGLLLMAPTPPTRPSADSIDVIAFDSLQVKFSPTEHLQEWRVVWMDIQPDVEAEIVKEKEQMVVKRIIYQGQATEADFALLSPEMKEKVTRYLQERKAEAHV